MRTLIVIFAIATSIAAASADEYVHGYTRSDGTPVQGYYRSDPNGTTSDNYSHEGNTNPYTGQRGYHTDQDSGE